jgi:hypothetical protein
MAELRKLIHKFYGAIPSDFMKVQVSRTEKTLDDVELHMHFQR